jgi:Carbamoyl-phosphate synthase L chain, ATP binding domain
MSSTFVMDTADEVVLAGGHVPESASKPVVLVVTTDRWYPTVRLAMALTKAGFLVEALCPPGHPLSKISTISRMHKYNGLRPLASLTKAIERAKPKLIIPADDLATGQLHQFYFQQKKLQREQQFCELVKRSLGAEDGYAVVSDRGAFMRVAEEEGIRVPKTAVVASNDELRMYVDSMGLPLVLKSNGSSGGDGVKVVHTLEEAERTLRKLKAPPLLARAIKHAALDRDLTLLVPSISRRQRVVNAQAFINGREATSTIACWNGVVLAALHFEVLQKMNSTGHATVLRLIQHQEMSSAAEKICKRLKLSGLYGLDFMLQTRTGSAFLIEINPRTTQVGHLTLGTGRDLPASLYAALAGTELHDGIKVTEKDIIVLFPHEWARDPQSEFLLRGYHDVPWEEPALVSDCVASALKKIKKNGIVSLADLAVLPSEAYEQAANDSQNASWIAEEQ